MKFSSTAASALSALAKSQEQLVCSELTARLVEATHLMSSCYREGGMVIANAPDPAYAPKAAHLFEELVGRYSANRASLPALTPGLGDNPLQCSVAKKNDLVVFFAPQETPELCATLLELRERKVKTIHIGESDIPEASLTLPLPQRLSKTKVPVSIAQRVVSSLYLHLLCECVEEPPGAPLSPEFVQHEIEEFIALCMSCSESLALSTALDMFEEKVSELNDRDIVLCCGNGGSVCDALEFNYQWNTSGRHSSVAFHSGEPGLLTCNANDFGFDSVFSRCIDGLAQRLHFLIALSSSGNSPNVIAAVHRAVHHKIPHLYLGGKSGGQLQEIADISYIVPSKRTARIQEIHLAILSALAVSCL